ncbi:hypothetical protein O6H91_15G009600 [Diphasiastrum complanatum]|nr:hypothetical protein O6H91_15G009600 [Diphasiastrum complanatum]
MASSSACLMAHLASFTSAITTTTTTTPTKIHAALLCRPLLSKPISCSLSSTNNAASTRPLALPALRSTALLGNRSHTPRAAASGVAVQEKSIAVGDKLPEGELSYLDKAGNIQTIKVSDLTQGKKVVIFAVPGAFTPTCTQKHVPGFTQKADELKAKGVDTIACVSVNDVFVLKAWGESLAVDDKILLLSDGSAEFTKALGVTLDLTGKPQGLGLRSRRYALLAEDGVVKVLNLEEGGSFTVSSAEEILKAL